MKYRVTTIAILMLAFFLKDAVTLVLVTGDMASAELSASGQLAALPPILSPDLAGIGPFAAPPLMPSVFLNAPPAMLDVAPSKQVMRVGGPGMAELAAELAATPPTCHAAPFSDQPTPLPEIGNGSQRVTTLGASGASGLEAILLGSGLLGMSSLLARRREAWRRLVGYVPAVAIPPG